MRLDGVGLFPLRLSVARGSGLVVLADLYLVSQFQASSWHFTAGLLCHCCLVLGVF